MKDDFFHLCCFHNFSKLLEERNLPPPMVWAALPFTVSVQRNSSIIHCTYADEVKGAKKLQSHEGTLDDNDGDEEVVKDADIIEEYVEPHTNTSKSIVSFIKPNDVFRLRYPDREDAEIQIVSVNELSSSSSCNTIKNHNSSIEVGNQILEDIKAIEQEIISEVENNQKKKSKKKKKPKAFSFVPLGTATIAMPWRLSSQYSRILYRHGISNNKSRCELIT